ncbi:DUF2797 domain-containing protein [Desulfuribacillus alkaliarsenatis]|uniref:DUF2797 domain-containing protein n=1 Tax=Desulfuribacillus alkaliarsenatis TaxID=766136 RepID=A0A1E5G2E0_9FIRM|nr:DUF2797 domain-containing protein [Desulfuribacillus alkaliarsenatis]OEF96701.1 hypothetical protein BHF68_06395 [Desulfuribacillus alkaliarsenatis]
MKLRGLNRGLSHKYDNPLHYYLTLDEQKHPINELIGESISITFENKIQCIHCGRIIKKTFNNGSCYPCFKSLPENDLCIVKPNLCHYHQGTCRDNEFAESHCMTPHYVYLAVSSDVKVGLTRATNTLKRWGDQGAVQAVPIAKLPTRKDAGDLELLLTKHYPDKTNWRKMLKGEITDMKLEDARQQAVTNIPEEYSPYVLREEQLIEFQYPMQQSASKLTSYNLDKQAQIEDKLVGIKGQYFIFASGIMNMKKFAGYHIELDTKK